MDNRDKATFVDIWTDTYALYRQRVSPGMLELTFNALCRYSLDEVKRGISAHVKNPDTGQFAPKPADVIRHLQGSSQSASGEAWAKVDYAVRCVGHYRSVVFDDPKIHAAIVRLGGWQKVALTTEDEYPFLRNNFLKLYAGFTVQPPENFPHVLLGVAAHQNSLQSEFKRGKDVDQPALIGDKERARLVYHQGGAQGVTQIHHAGTQEFLDALTGPLAERLNHDRDAGV